ncbi:MAG: class I SAM-dependent methyltransferase [Patescibacteria group bacterium]
MDCLLCRKKISDVIASELRSGDKRKVFYCKKCELGILGDVTSNEDLKKFYKINYRKTVSQKLGSGMSPHEIFLAEIQFQNNRLTFLNKYFGKNKRLLDVGCSAGMFLWHARKYVKEAVGIDYDSRSAKFAARKCRCKTYSTDIEQTTLEEKSFDIICAFQTLEHVSDPIDFIGRYKKYLKPGGVMAIEVPNLRDSLLYAYDVPFYEKFYFHNAHLWYFTAASLEKLMTKSGFVGEAFSYQSYNFMNHMHWIFKDAPQPNGLPARLRPVLPVRSSVDPKLKDALNDFIRTTDMEYRRLLAELGVAANLFYVGKMD